MQKPLLPSTYILRLRCAQVFIVPHLFGKPNYKFPGFPYCHFIVLQQSVVSDVTATLPLYGFQALHNTFWRNVSRFPFPLLYFLFIFFLPVTYRPMIPFSFFPHAIISFVLSLLTSTSYKIQMPHKNCEIFWGYVFFSMALNLFLFFYVFIIHIYFPVIVFIFLDPFL